MKKSIPLILSLGLVLGLNIYFRSFTINFPQLKAQAKDIIEKTTQQIALQEVYKKFPQFYPLAKDKIIKSKIYMYNRQNRQIINARIQDLYAKLKDKFQDDTGQTYLMELDCWHWARYVENVVKFGHPGDESIYGRQWDLLMLAPLGSYLYWDQFLFYFSAFLYKFFSIFKSVPLFNFLFYLPLLFAAIFTIVLYLCSFRYGSYLGGVISCLLVGLSPIFLQRSYAGWFDKDILNLLFPLLITWTYLVSTTSSTFKHRLLWICFSSFWVGLFCFNWTHWWFIFLIVIMYEFLNLGYLIFTRFYFKKANIDLLKQHIFSLLSFLLLSFFWIIFFAGIEPLVALYKQIRLALILNKPLMASIWPNVYATVGELRSLSLREVAGSIGGVWIFLFSLLCMLALIIRALFIRKYDDFKRGSIIILAIWFISMLFASSRGVRFVVFLLIPLGVSAGWVTNEAYEYFKNKKNIWGIFLVAMVFLVFFSISVKQAQNTAKGLYPLINDTWYKTLNLIKEKTPQQTIINSWWDFGDWFKVIARRRVIFDGQSQDAPQAYWMAKALLTNNEEESIRILRMFNNAGNRAFEIINERIKDPLQSILLLENVLLLKPDKVQQTLLEFLPATAVEEVMKILFFNPSRAIFIVEDSMIPKMGAISYLGDWDFSKVYIAQNFNIKEKDQIIEYLKKLGRDSQNIERFYQEAFLITTKNLDDWLSYRIQFYSGLANGREKDGMVFFDNGFIYNPKEQTIQSNAGHIPRSLFVLIENNFIEKMYPNANQGFSILVIKTEEGYKCILLARELGNSMFVRLYFFKGKGLKYFTPFIDAEEGNNYIRIFNIAW